jgi:hypothetical protein
MIYKTTYAKDLFSNVTYDHTGCEYETINPMKDLSLINPKGTLNRFVGNVATMTNFIFEMDKHEVNGVMVPYTIEEQMEVIYKVNGYRINRLVFSGHNSIHSRITIEDEPDTAEQYKFIHDLLNATFWGGKADSALGTPSHLTRAPNGIREDGTLQDLIYKNDCIFDFEWRTAWKAHEQAKLAKKQQSTSTPENVNGYGKYNQQFQRKNKSSYTKLFFRGKPNVWGQRILAHDTSDGWKNANWPSAIGSLKGCGYTLLEVENLLSYYTDDLKNYGLRLYNGMI